MVGLQGVCVVKRARNAASKVWSCGRWVLGVLNLNEVRCRAITCHTGRYKT